MMKNYFSFILLLLCAISNAQIQFQEHIIYEYNLTNLNRIYAADLNKDGKLDVLIDDPSGGRISWFKNLDGFGNFSEPIIVSSEINSPVSSILPVDVDNDGLLDIVYDVGNQIKWIKNSNNANEFINPQFIENYIVKPGDIKAGDINNDDDTDIITISTGDGELMWYENTNEVVKFNDEENLIASDLTSVQSVATGDLNGDGNLDVITAFYNSVVWYKNNGVEPRFTESNIISTNVAYAYSVVSADLDGDLDLDILVPSFFDDSIYWYENLDGKGNFGEEKVVTAVSNNVRKLVVADIDNDNDLDIISDSDNNNLVWYENTDGKGNYGPQQIISQNYINIKYINTSDIDGDDDVDILVVYNDGTVAWYENTNLQSNEIFGFVRVGLNNQDCEETSAVMSDIMIRSVTAEDTLATFTMSNGFYQLYPKSGNYSTSVALDNLADYLNPDPESQTTEFNSFGIKEQIDFCIKTSEINHNLSVQIIPITEARPGFIAEYEIVFMNEGYLNISGDILIEFPNELITLIDSQVEFNPLDSGKISFAFENLQVFEKRKFSLSFKVEEPPKVNNGDKLIFNLNIEPSINDINPEDNSFQFEQTVIGSYDPNDITVLEGSEIYKEQTSEYLNYIIRFQNTGTASAINVKIGHELDEKLDWNTFKPISASHTGRVEIKNGKLVEFLYNNINLPDSTSNEKESHGYVAFKIKPKSNINVGEIIKAKAAIYFDFNLPVITNEVTTTVIDKIAGEPKVEIIPIAEISCNGSSDAEMEFKVTGGASPYQYQLFDNDENLISTSQDNIFINLSAGNYTIKISDNASNKISKAFQITEPDLLMAEATSIATTCIGLSDGEINIEAIGGTPPYEYKLNEQTYSENKDYPSLPAGEYEVWVKDANNCTYSQSFTVKDPLDSDLDGDGLSDACDDDIDGDGILNEDDACDDTNNGEPINDSGCSIFTLPPANFNVTNTSETCRSSNNGKIGISAEAMYEYTASLSGNEINKSIEFTSETEFVNLITGIYELCITISDYPEFEQCYNIEIVEPDALEVNSIVNMANRTVHLELKGSKEYTIRVNDLIYKTTNDEIELNLTDERNTISVNTNLDCQGNFSEHILLGSELVLYPNPVTEGKINIKFPNPNYNDLIEAKLYSDSGRQVLSKNIRSQGGTFSLKMDGISPGVYTIMIKSEEKSYYSRIIKK